MVQNHHITIMKKIFTPLLTSIAFLICFAAYSAPPKTVYTFLAGASWTNGMHWSLDGISACSCAPDDSKDDIYIDHNATVAQDLTFGSGASLIMRSGADMDQTGDLDLNSGSLMEIQSGSVLTITGDFVIKNGATLDIQTGGKIIVNGDVTNQNNSDQVTINGELVINGSFTGNNGSEIGGAGSISATGTISTLGTGSIFGGTGSCSTGPCFTSAASPLPIDLLSFNANLTESGAIEITWKTATEINNDFFTIERSSNGSTFVEIAEEPGAGNSTSILEYTVYDDEPMEGNTYYRLKQTDFDGKFEYFDMVAVSLIKNSDGSCVFKVYPNPCMGACTLSLSECQEQESATIQVEVIDAGGNKIIQEIPYRNSDGSFLYNIDTSNNLAPGLYVINARSASENYNQKMIVK